MIQTSLQLYPVTCLKKKIFILTRLLLCFYVSAMKCICLITGSVSDLNSRMHCEKYSLTIIFQVASKAECALAFLSV